MELFSFTSDEEVSFELTNKNGMQLKVTNYGATITLIENATENGEIVDVVLGWIL
jgi:aldose 1-epimerase